MLTAICTEPLVRRAAAEGVIDPRLRRHRMIVLPSPLGCSTRAVLQPLALNDCGEVTGVIFSDHDEENCELRPFVWSLCGRFDLGAGAAWNLAELASDSSKFGVGYSVNNEGVVAGSLRESKFVFDGHPWLWDLATFVAPSGPLGTGGAFPLGSGDIGEARGINNDSPAIVAGWSKSSTAAERGFRYQVGDTPSSIVPLPLFAGDPGHLALAVPTTTTGPERIFGGSLGGVTGGSPNCINLVHDEALVWEVGASTTVDALIEDVSTPSNLTYWQGRALAANSQGQSAGWRRQIEVFEDCTLRGIFSENDGTPVVVGLIAPIPADSETEVRGMTGADNDGNRVLLEGADVLGQLGVFWWRNPTSGDFEAEVFGSAPWPIEVHVVGGATLDETSRLNAVNQAGWILGEGFFDGSSSTSGFLLIPDPCSADLDLNGLVDGADLGALLAGWGPCAGPAYCPGDLNHDGEVEGADLGLMLAAWGECDFVTQVCAFTNCASALSMSQSSDEASHLADEAIVALLLAVGFASAEEFTEWIVSASPTQVQAIGILIAELAEMQNGGGK